jgi:protein-S-isoprenylcysteine O-methyltransferase Ste14
VPLWLRSLLFTVIVPGSVAGYIPWALVSGANRFPLHLGPARMWGLLPLGLGICVYVATTWQFGSAGRGTPAPWDPPRELVRSGLHARVRNPMYLGVLSCLLGEALLRDAGILLGYLVLVWVAFHVRVVIVEEPGLRRAFGPTFDTYVSRVPRWIPRWSTPTWRTSTPDEG